MCLVTAVFALHVRRKSSPLTYLGDATLIWWTYLTVLTSLHQMWNWDRFSLVLVFYGIHCVVALGLINLPGRGPVTDEQSRS